MARITIYVSDDLKRRMDEAEEVNWSPLACRAFEQKLASITADKQATRDPSGSWLNQAWVGMNHR